MTFSPLLRVVYLARRPRDHRPASGPDGLAVSQVARRDPATTGYDVSPVHGRHCICRRCEQLADLGR